MHKPDATPTLISDIDGTLSNFRHRLKLIRVPHPDWDQFNRESAADLPVQGVINILRLADMQRWDIVLVTGRPQRYRSLTEQWLARHKVPYNALFMRGNEDHRSDSDVKCDIYTQYLIGKNIQFVLEDRDNLVEMWRGFGVPCLQVQKGAY